MNRIPKRVQVDWRWHEVRAGWAGKLELYEHSHTPNFTAEQPYVHISSLYFVYNSNGSKVGEFHIDNNTCSGNINSFEM